MKRGARLGQHFLNASWVAEALVTSLSISPDDTVVEIGPGRGALTTHLLATGATVIAIEKDEHLAEELATTFASAISSGRLVLHTLDIRDIDMSLLPKEYVLAANIPYYITGEIIRTFLESTHQPRRMALLIQKEVAERICSRDKESILSLSVKAYGTPSLVAIVPAGCFSPPPSVASAILHVDAISKHRFAAVSEAHFFTVLRAGFSSKRKLLANNLAKHVGPIDLAQCSVQPTARAEDVSLEQWFCIASHVIDPASVS